MRHECGCVNEVHAPSGVLQCVRKCDRHMQASRDPTTIGRAYYEELGLLAGDALRPTAHVAELVEALGPIPAVTYVNHHAMEIGCGCSPYVGGIQAAGWQYTGLDCSGWAAAWTGEHWGVTTREALWEAWGGDHRYGLILAAHVLEHLADAPAGLAKMADSLSPGGTLLVVVPDDSDPVNPDHMWLFTPDTLRACAESAGLEVERLEIRWIVKHERFVYLKARKP